MTLNSAQTLFLTLAFLVPGFIIDSVFSKFVPRQRPESFVAFLRYLTFSCLNWVLWCWPVYWVIFEGVSALVTFLCWVLVTIVSPIAIALLLSYAHQRQWLRWLADKARLRVIHTTPTAWDYVFSRQEPSLVQITLANGTQIRGDYSYGSFSSSDPSHRDIYVEQVCRLDGQEWKPLRRGTSVLVTSRSIEYIQFMPRRGISKKDA